MDCVRWLRVKKLIVLPGNESGPFSRRADLRTASLNKIVQLSPESRLVLFVKISSNLPPCETLACIHFTKLVLKIDNISVTVNEKVENVVCLSIAAPSETQHAVHVSPGIFNDFFMALFVKLLLGNRVKPGCQTVSSNLPDWQTFTQSR
jgi:hypothetical protein